MTSSAPRLTWRQLHWPRPLDPSQADACLRQWAADGRSSLIVLEVRAEAGRVHYLLGTAPESLAAVTGTLQHLAGTAATPPNTDRRAVDAAGRLTATTRHRPLRLQEPEHIVRALLAALTSTGRDEHLVLQLMLGPRRTPLVVPSQSPSSLVAPWWRVAWHGDGPLDSEQRTALRTKLAHHGFACTIRLGATAGTPGRRRTLLLGLLAALRTAEATGVRLGLAPDRAARLTAAARPCRWPLRLSVPELLPLTGWPLGEADLPGQPAAHPKLLPPAPGTTGLQRVIAAATAPGSPGALALGVRRALQHLHVVGPTGTGKSTLLANLIGQDLADGRAVVVIEPKGDLVTDVLARVPAERQDDIVVLDPNEAAPVGLNPLARHGRPPELVADNVLTVFKQLYGRAIGPRSQDILYASLLTLARREGASLALLPLLLTNPAVRRALVADIRDPLLLEPFWASYEAWSDAERTAAIAPVMNKLRPLLRAGVRGVIGQRAPRFAVDQVLSERRVLLVPLQRGVIGAEAAGLLGSLLVAELWRVIQARAAIPPERRHPVMVYIDEVQDYLHTGTDLGEALAQARGYGAGFTLAHQFLGQLPPEMRAAILANARSRACFQLGVDDARVFAAGHSELTPADFMALGQYEVYVSLFSGERVSPYASGCTLPLPPTTTDPAELRRRSSERWGRPLAEVEGELAEFATASDVPLGATGRRRRQP